MRHRAFVISSSLLALALWAGLVIFVNRRPPELINQAIFLVFWGVTVACTAMPLACLVNARLARPPVAERAPGRAVREGMLLGVLAVTLMVLQLMRLLNPLVGGILALVVVLVEVLLLLRER